jgi:hypothetical protein
MTECVLCDWTIDWQAPPLAAYLIGAAFPLRWYPDGPGPVWASEVVTPESTARVAVVAHWAEAHPEQLELALGEPFEVRPMGPPPVDTVFGVDLGSDSMTVVKAHKIWIAPLPPPGEPVDGDVWVDIGGLVSPLEFRYSIGYDE